MGYYGPPVVTGGGAGTFNQYTIFFEDIGPTYATGGFVIDLTATFSTLNAFKLAVKKGTRGNVPYGRLRYALNSPSAGKATVIIEKFQQERVSSFDNITGQPSGVTVLSASGGDSSAEAAHTHDATHDHAATASSAMTAAGAGVDTDSLAPAIDAHTHLVDLPSMALTSGAGTSHMHRDNNIYEHTHTITYTVTNVSTAELANAVDLSATTFYGVASGVRA